MGTLDWVLRIALAVLIVGLYYQERLSGGWALGLLAVAGIFIVTSFLSFCPLYLPFGLSTRRQG